MNQREIKFRHWCPESKVLTSFELIRLLPSDRMLSEALGLDEFGGFLLQYTGLKDKNGKEIYEGDIVAEIFYKKVVGKYEVKYDGFQIAPFTLGSEFESTCLPNDCEVIGNVFENPELLSENGIVSPSKTTEA